MAPLKKLISSLLIVCSLFFLSAAKSGTAPNSPLVPITDASVYKYLETSVIILDSVQEGVRYYGSGTVVGQDNEYAYVLSCAHLYEKNSTRKKFAVGIYYKNGVKLKQSLRYDAEIIGLSHPDDICFLRFKIKEKVAFSQIAPLDYKYVPGTDVISDGCDQAILYIAAYRSKLDGWKDINMGNYKCQKCGGTHEYVKDLVTVLPGARGGRSGGSLLTLDNKIIGVLSRATDVVSGTGQSYFISLKDIHSYAKKWNLEFLLNEPSKLWETAVVHTKDGDVLAKDYLPMP